MTDDDQTIIFSQIGDNGLPDRLEAFDDFAVTDDRPTDFAPSLVSLAYIRAAIRRTRRFWCTMAVIGLFVGLGLHVTSPPTYKASTALLLTLGPYEGVQTAAADNQAMAESNAVAGLAVRQLGLQQSPSGFLTTYTVTAPTDRVLDITVSGPSGDQALLRANAVATAFLQFRADELRTAQKLVLQSLNQQINQIRQNISSINAQISQLSAQPTSGEQQSQLTNLRGQRSDADNTLSNLAQTVVSDQTNVQPATSAAINGSVVLDPPALLPHSRLKPLILYSAVGLIVGLALGLGIAVIRAIVSDRLRQRDDVAYALGAPVKLSVATARLKRRPWSRPKLATDDETDVRRIVAHLDDAMPGRAGAISGLAVVPVDDPRVPALCLVSLAVSMAEQGKRVVVADLCSGAPAAKLLGAEDPGVRAVSAQQIRLTVAVPEHDDAAPAGPLNRGSALVGSSSFAKAVADACASADVLLTLATLDPSIGGDHLSTWATDAVAFVTAGRSSATKINATGEMIRLSGTRLVSAVLVGADNSDESLGVIDGPRADFTEHGSRSGTKGLVITVDEIRDRRRPTTIDPWNP